MESSEIRFLALFFFFSFLDEKTTTTSASEAYGLFVNHMKKHPQNDRKEALLKAAYTTYLKIKKKNKKAAPRKNDLSFALSGAIDIGPWREFHKNANSEDMLVVILKQILGASENEVARCLQISVGSVRYRLGKALPLLGEYA
ncbi:MAG: hypothetical protein AB7O96_17445 [Pseudobdellovibrionaceae bacterium]